MVLTKGINYNNLIKLNSSVDTEGIPPLKRSARSNFAIAAAITSYARIHMIDLKLNHDVCYSDTDSIFTTHPLPDHLIGQDIGQLKDEKGGVLIDKAYFLGIKQYGYTFKNNVDDLGNQINKSVWEGVTRDTIPFQIIEDIANGATHNIEVEKKILRDFYNLNITIKPINHRVLDNKEKLLVGNSYYPASVNNPI